MFQVRYEGFKRMSYDPQNSKDPENWIRKCPHCGVMWVRTSGCSGQTTCGANPMSPDCQPSLQSWAKEMIAKHIFWYKGDVAKQTGGHFDLNPNSIGVLSEGRVGCGKPFVWDKQTGGHFDLNPNSIGVLSEGHVGCG